MLKQCDGVVPSGDWLDARVRRPWVSPRAPARGLTFDAPEASAGPRARAQPPTPSTLTSQTSGARNGAARQSVKLFVLFIRTPMGIMLMTLTSPFLHFGALGVTRLLGQLQPFKSFNQFIKIIYLSIETHCWKYT